MTVKISKNYEDMSLQAVLDLLKLIQYKKNPVICTASGDTPALMYRTLIEQVNKNDIDISGWHFIGLDEWAGMNGNDEGSCRYHLNKQLFHPLNIAEDKIAFFDGGAKNLKAQCDGIEDYIRLHGGIDVAILGLGMNGHVGMNEPGASALQHAHVAEIHKATQKVGRKYFTTEQKLTHGLTLGIASLIEASHLMLLVNGINKADIVRRFLESGPTPELPASLLELHNSFVVYLESESASLTGLNK